MVHRAIGSLCHTRASFGVTMRVVLWAAVLFVFAAGSFLVGAAAEIKAEAHEVLKATTRLTRVTHEDLVTLIAWAGLRGRGLRLWTWFGLGAWSRIWASFYGEAGGHSYTT